MLFTSNTSLAASFNEKFLWLPAELSKDWKIACVCTTGDLTFTPLPDLTGKTNIRDPLEFVLTDNNIFWTSKCEIKKNLIWVTNVDFSFFILTVPVSKWKKI